MRKSKYIFLTYRCVYEYMCEFVCYNKETYSCPPFHLKTCIICPFVELC